MLSRPPAPANAKTPLQALLRAHAQSAQGMAVYLIGGGAWVASALLALAYREHFSAALRGLPDAMAVLAVLWVGVGGYLARRNHRTLQAYDHVYQASVQRLTPSRHHTCAAQGWAARPPSVSIPHPLAQRAAAQPTRPVSLFGASGMPQAYTAVR